MQFSLDKYYKAKAKKSKLIKELLLDVYRRNLTDMPPRRFFAIGSQDSCSGAAVVSNQWGMWFEARSDIEAKIIIAEQLARENKEVYDIQYGPSSQEMKPCDFTGVYRWVRMMVRN